MFIFFFLLKHFKLFQLDIYRSDSWRPRSGPQEKKGEALKAKHPSNIPLAKQSHQWMNFLLIREKVSRWMVAIYSSHCFAGYTCWIQQRKLHSLKTSPLPFQVGQFEARRSIFVIPDLIQRSWQPVFKWSLLDRAVFLPRQRPHSVFAQKSSLKVQASRKAGLVPARGLWDVTPATAVNICWEPKIWVNNFRVEAVTHTLRQQGDSS